MLVTLKSNKATSNCGNGVKYSLTRIWCWKHLKQQTEESLDAIRQGGINAMPVLR